MIIELGPRVFNSGNLDADGTLWRVVSWEGWGTPPARLAEASATSQHGSTPTEQMWGSRSVILKGLASSLTEAGMDASWDSLCGAAGDLLTPVPLVVRQTIPKVLPVVSGGDPDPQMIGGLTFAFSIPLIAHSPFKLALTPRVVAVPAGATIVITNEGNWSATPTITVTSAGTVDLLHVPTNARLLASALPSGAAFAGAAHTVRSSSGADLFTATPPGAVWWTLAPGDNAITNAGTAAVTVTYYDTWI